MEYKQLKNNIVEFSHKGVIHRRTVNPVLVDGKPDKKATKAIIDQLSDGIAHKIEIGVITNEVFNGPSIEQE